MESGDIWRLYTGTYTQATEKVWCFFLFVAALYWYMSFMIWKIIVLLMDGTGSCVCMRTGRHAGCLLFLG